MSEKSAGRVFGRRRRANSDADSGERSKRYSVWVNLEEQVQLKARAVAAGVTVPRLMFEAAMVPHGQTHTDRMELAKELFAIRRLTANIANNVNQMAKFANAEGVVPREAAAVLAEYRALYPKLSDAVEALART